MKFNFLKAQYDQETKDWQEKERNYQQERQDLMNKNMELNEEVNRLHKKIESIQT